MRYLRSFVRFWVDFIVGDAWEVAAGIGLTLALLAVAIRRFGSGPGLGFILLASVLAVTWIALLRATRTAGKSPQQALG